MYTPRLTSAQRKRLGWTEVRGITVEGGLTRVLIYKSSPHCASDDRVTPEFAGHCMEDGSRIGNQVRVGSSSILHVLTMILAQNDLEIFISGPSGNAWISEVASIHETATCNKE